MVNRFYLKLSTVLVVLALSIVFFNDTAYCRFYKWTDDNGQMHITDYPPPEGETPKEPEKEQTTETLGVQASPSPSPSVSAPVKGVSGAQAERPKTAPTTPVPPKSTPPPVSVTRPQPSPTSMPRAAAPVATAAPAPAVSPAATAPKTPKEHTVVSTKPQPPATAVPTTTTVASAPPVATPHPTPAAPHRVMPSMTKTKQGKLASLIHGVEMFKRELADLVAYILVRLVVALLITLVFSFALYKIAKRLNVASAWMAWVPLLNLFTMVRMAGRPVWWGVLFLIPIVGNVLFVILWMDICQRLGLKKTLGLLMLIPMLVPSVLMVLSLGHIAGTSKVSMIASMVLFFLSASVVFLLPLYYLWLAGRKPQSQMDYGYDPYDQDTVPTDSLPEEVLPGFLHKTSSESPDTTEDEGQPQGDYISAEGHEETAEIIRVAPDQYSTEGIPASDISFGREYILDTDEGKAIDTEGSFAHSEDSTMVVRDSVELREKSEVEFEPVIEIGSGDDFRSEDEGMVIETGELGIDGVEEGSHPSEIAEMEIAGIEMPEEEASEDSTWVLGKDVSNKPQEDIKAETPKQEEISGAIDFAIEMPEEESSEDSTWVLGKDVSNKHQEDIKPEIPKPEEISGAIEFGIDMPEEESSSEDSTWVLGTDVSSKPQEDIKAETPKQEEISGAIEFGIDEDIAEQEEPTLALNQDNVGMTRRAFNEEPVVELSSRGGFGEDTQGLAPELPMYKDQLEIDGLLQEEPLGASEDITLDYSSDTAQRDKGDVEIEPAVGLDDELDFDMQEDIAFAVAVVVVYVFDLPVQVCYRCR
ncbi:MAG: DUF4124 domain-containing protein [Nitrospirae bacterium]|nr:DUF4124 domain-containing protein [Nitrospirota bacterium]